MENEKRRVGASFAEFLDEQVIREDVEGKAVKELIADMSAIDLEIRPDRARVLSDIRVTLNALPEDPYPEPLWDAKVEAVWDFVIQRYGSPGATA